VYQYTVADAEGNCVSFKLPLTLFLCALSAQAGGAGIMRGAHKNYVMGALAMAVTATVGVMFSAAGDDE
jgi:hypothetical protein